MKRDAIHKYTNIWRDKDRARTSKRCKQTWLVYFHRCIFVFHRTINFASRFFCSTKKRLAFPVWLNYFWVILIVVHWPERYTIDTEFRNFCCGLLICLHLMLTTCMVPDTKTTTKRRGMIMKRYRNENWITFYADAMRNGTTLFKIRIWFCDTSSSNQTIGSLKCDTE